MSLNSALISSLGLFTDSKQVKTRLNPYFAANFKYALSFSTVECSG